MLHFWFSLKSNIYLFGNFIFDKRIFLPFTGYRNNYRWSVKTREKNSEYKSNYRKKTVEMKKVLISTPKTSSFLSAMTMEWHCVF